MGTLTTWHTQHETSLPQRRRSTVEVSHCDDVALRAVAGDRDWDRM